MLKNEPKTLEELKELVIKLDNGLKALSKTAKNNDSIGGDGIYTRATSKAINSYREHADLNALLLFLKEERGHYSRLLEKLETAIIEHNAQQKKEASFIEEAFDSVNRSTTRFNMPPYYD